MFRMIRCGRGYNLVIVVSTADGAPDAPDAKFYRYASWQIDNCKPDVLLEIDRATAMNYFSGHADGLGFEEVPKDILPSLEVVTSFIEEKRNVAAKIRLERSGAGNISDEELRERLRVALVDIHVWN